MNAEQALRRYSRLQDHLTTPFSSDIPCEDGFVLAKSCRYCRARKPVINDEGSIRCSRCNAEWPRDQVFLRRGEVQENRRKNRGASNAMVEMSDLRIRLDRANKRCPIGFNLLWYYVVEEIGGYRKLAEHGRRLWPNVPFAWNKDKVYRLLGTARRIIDEELTVDA